MCNPVQCVRVYIIYLRHIYIYRAYILRDLSYSKKRIALGTKKGSLFFPRDIFCTDVAPTIVCAYNVKGKCLISFFLSFFFFHLYTCYIGIISAGGVVLHIIIYTVCTHVYTRVLFEKKKKKKEKCTRQELRCYNDVIFLTFF